MITEYNLLVDLIQIMGASKNTVFTAKTQSPQRNNIKK